MRLTLAVIILAAMIGCVPQNGPRSIQPSATVTLRVRNQTPTQLAVYVSGTRVRVGTVLSFSDRCLSVSGSGDVALYAVAFADASGAIFSPIFSFAPGESWTWMIGTTAFDLAPDLVPGAECGQTRQQA